MKYSLRSLMIVAIVLPLLISCCLWSTVLNAARRSDAVIRAEILSATPPRSSRQVVENYAKSRFTQDNFFHWDDPQQKNELTALYGEYWASDSFPWSVCVRVTWKFDSSGLNDVVVDRWMDAP
jgi:hypothetical protein